MSINLSPIYCQLAQMNQEIHTLIQYCITGMTGPTGALGARVSQGRQPTREPLDQPEIQGPQVSQVRQPTLARLDLLGQLVIQDQLDSQELLDKQALLARLDLLAQLVIQGLQGQLESPAQ